jgi:phytoene dehydrogenase-like protein
VVERRGQLGGACTLETPFADDRFVMSPCAYLVGLLHPLVVEELGLRRRGYRVQPVDPHLWCPLEDGTALTLWDDPVRTAASVAEVSPGDVDGYLAYETLFGRLRRALRGAYTEETDTWLGPAPGRGELERRLGHDPELIEILFDTPIADVIERHVGDERLRTALHGQGIIGTFAGPRDAGTAAVHAMHSLGTLEGRPGAWGYVEGGMGRVSLALAEAATEAGAVILTDAPVAAIIAGESAGPAVVLEGGDVIRAKAVVSNADPKRTLALCQAGGGDAPAGFGAFADKIAGWRSESPVVKLNCALGRLPTFTAAARAGYEGPPPYRAMVTVSTGTDATQAACEAARRGEAAPAWCELYFQTAYDGSVAPPGAHTMSVFAQYVPYALAEGDWDRRREAIADLVIAEIARFAPDVADCIVERQVLGPPDVEARIGLTGGHIFHGECLPDQMWDRRFGPATPVPGLYLCGAGTHPGGSVIAANGRNAAMAVLTRSR